MPNETIIEVNDLRVSYQSTSSADGHANRLGSTSCPIQRRSGRCRTRAVPSFTAQAEELAALRERNRLAREMHDSLGHALVLINVKLEAAQRLYAVDPNQGAAELEATRALVRDTMSELRASLANLRSSPPNRHDLPVALQRLASDFHERSNLDIACNLPTELPELAPPTAEALWHVAREALANVERHAASRQRYT